MADRHESVTQANTETPGEGRPSQDVAALFSNLHLSNMQYQPFSRRRIAKTPEVTVEAKLLPQTPPAKGARVHVGVFSPMGGAGASTLTASLGSILCQLGKGVLLVDTSPWQALAFHFGATETRPGRRTFSAPGSGDRKVHILACDESARFPDLESFTATTRVDCVLFDLGGMSGETLDVCLRECDTLIVPLLPDPSAVRLAKAAKLLLDKLGVSPPRAQFVLNRMDDSHDAKEVQALLDRFLGEDLFPLAISYQSDVHDAISNGVVLPFYAPEAQATSVCRDIVQWLQIPEMDLKKTELRWSEEWSD
jgi:MinD-like ATPase involved in chromosome partitioning or flagellar assembly